MEIFWLLLNTNLQSDLIVRNQFLSVFLSLTRRSFQYRENFYFLSSLWCLKKSTTKNFFVRHLTTEAPQRSVKKKILLNFFSSSGIGTWRVQSQGDPKKIFEIVKLRDSGVDTGRIYEGSYLDYRGDWRKNLR